MMEEPTTSAPAGKSGYITKEGAQFYTWKRRFLVIEQLGISYYVNGQKKEKKGEIPIRNILEVKVFSKYKEREFVFGVVTKDRTYYIQGSDTENRDSWCNAINEAMQRIKTMANLPSLSVSSPRKHHTQSDIEKKVSVEDFKQIKVIGKGGFGRVLLVKKKDTGKYYAMKVLKKSVIVSRGEVEHTKTEKSVMAKVEHPFLAKLHWSFQTDTNLYFIMDFVNGGELFHHLTREKRFSEDRARFYAAEIVSGMGYLHECGIIYRDLKPENLLLDSKGHIVMTDFGLSKEGLLNPEDATRTFCGTPEYLAPEIINGGTYTKAIDWWAVGTLIYEMLAGLPPFYTDQEEQMYQKILTADVVIPQRFSKEVGDLIKKLLERDPEKRLQDANEIKKHPWFEPIDWEKLESLSIAPPFIPQVKSPDDVQNIDKAFLKESLKESDDEGNNDPVPEGDYFGGFTFQEEPNNNKKD